MSLLVPALRLRSRLLIALLVGGAVWVVDAYVDFLLDGSPPFRRGILRPSPEEIFTRLLVVMLVLLLFHSTELSRRFRIFASTLEAAPDGIQITTLEGIVAYSNEAVRTIFGFSPAELLGKHVNSMNADPVFASRVILPVLQKEGRWEGELDVKHKDGRIFTIWLTTSILRNPRGRPMGAIGVIRDISDRKRSEQALRDYARRLEEATGLKDLFSDILRHDLLGPATVVQLSLDSLLTRNPPPAQSRKFLETARRSCAKLTAMIEEAARYAKLSAAREIAFNDLELGAVLGEIVAECQLGQKERNARVVFQPTREYRVRANPMIADVFENLVSNALKYGGQDTIRIDVQDEGERWRVSVADTGEGIADEDKQRVFDRFERLRKQGVKGTGLGLAIAKRIVDLHGGKIWVEDNPGGGAVFCVSLQKAA